MEEGSLLQEALNNENSLENALIVDVYLVDHPSQVKKNNKKATSSASSSSSVENLLALAETAVKLNDFLQTQPNKSTPKQQKDSNNNSPYPWLQGGDGPVFGVHVTERIPHLRAVCQYGVSVADEWMLIHKMLEFSALHDLHLNDPTKTPTTGSTSNNSDVLPAFELAIECWDVDDGQVLLIESADALPDWVDRIGPINCRHRCWIRAGRVQLIAPMDMEEVAVATGDDQSTGMSTSLSLEQSLAALVSLSLEQALTELQQNDPARVSAPSRVNLAIQATCQRVDKSTKWHTTAIAVPRSVAWLVHSRPDLVAAACQAFAEHAANSHPKDKDQQQQQQQHSNRNNDDAAAAEVLAGTCQDWVWTTVRLGRTHYSMLRTVMAAPDWNSEHAIPSRYRSIEVKRLQRQCAVQATPHLRYALQVGVRLVAGLDYILLSQPQPQQPQQLQHPQPVSSTSLTERRVLSYWSRINSECQATQDIPNGEWLLQAWQAGPNQAKYDIASVFKCPVFEEEVKDYVLPLSRPGEVLSTVVKKELLKTKHPERDFVLPRPQDVDDEKWMAMPSDQEMGQASVSAQSPLPQKDETLPSSSPPSAATAAAPEENDLDKVLGGFQSFMTGKSGVDGISSQTTTTSERRPTQINPTVFLNILHTVLQAKSPEDISFAPAPVAEEQDPFFSREDYDCMDPEEDDDDKEDNEDIDMTNLMQAMDQELQSAATSRDIDRTNVPEGVTDEKVVQDAHVLSNLLESMDAGAGGPGPMQNIMKEMGLVPPTLPSEDDDDNDEEE